MVSKELKDKTVCITGLGYVGQPLAEAFSNHMRTIGFDVDQSKVNRINSIGCKFLCTSDPSFIKQADFVLICVPTPVTKQKEPDLCPVESAAEIVGKNLRRGAIVALESTVYPGVTEEIVVPILEKESGLSCGIDFKVGYSPERVNPADNEHTIQKITKIVTGMDEESTINLAALYSLITKVYIAKDIKTAEAAKVIENIQRDLNIALMNELSIVFNKMGLDMPAIIDAARTKWNFNNYTPGLVGGHCIPVDPYYLVYKARELGYHPQVILAGRSINDYMPKYVAETTIKGLNEADKKINGSKVLIMGLTYKENVPDTRESPAIEMVACLKDYKVDVYGHDPLLNRNDIEKFGVKALDDPFSVEADCLIFNVPHDKFKSINIKNLREILGDNLVIVDVKNMFRTDPDRGSLRLYYNL